MRDRTRLPQEQLLDLLLQTEQQHTIALLVKDDELQVKDDELVVKADELQIKDDELAIKADIIEQLEQQNEKWKLAYDKLWRERFDARSERYLADPDQLRLDFGSTDDAADASAGLAAALAGADLYPAHQQRSPLTTAPRTPPRQYRVKCSDLLGIHLCIGSIPPERLYKADIPESALDMINERVAS